ncbi:hypothetical protein [Levilactobacillus sp. N40-8-2]|uniref:hypothetical protein n=1 Tax=Levilactobacillus muriae TaxID=3238987 RepID=UPI0038B3DCC1
MHQQYETLAYASPLKIKRQVVGMMTKTVNLIADVNLETGEVKLVVSPADLQKLRKDAKISDQ